MVKPSQLLRRRRDDPEPERSRSRAYNLVVLTVSVTLLNIWVAANLPLWSHQIQRDKEAELIFRGMQYAEGIRRFQAEFSRYPTSLKELIEVEPRCMRQLYPNPMREDGRWGLVPVGVQGQPGGDSGQGPDPGETSSGLFETGVGDNEGEEAGVLLSADPNDTFGGPPSSVPIRGVFAAESVDASRIFLGKENTREWQFTVELVSAMKPADPSNPTFQTPFVASEIGKPFPPGVVPQVPQPSDQPVQPPADNVQGPGGTNGSGPGGGPAGGGGSGLRPSQGSGHLGGGGLPAGAEQGSPRG